MSLIQALYNNYQRDPNRVSISQLDPIEASDQERQSKTWSAKDLYLQSFKIGQYLKQLEVQAQDRIAIISNSRPEWILADFGIMFQNAVSVSIYQTLTPEEIAYILYDSSSEVVFAENKEQIDKLLELLESEVEIPAVEDRPATKFKLNLKKIITFEKVDDHPLVIHLDNLFQNSEDLDLSQCPEISSDSLASLVYTSGTTGMPKGVMQTHANHLANIKQVQNSGIIDNSPSIFLFLPLAHSFAKLMAYLGVLTEGSLLFPSVHDKQHSKFDPDKINQDLPASNAHIIPIVPRILEKVQSALEQKSKTSGAQAKILALTLWSAKYRQNNFIAKLAFAVTKSIRQKLQSKLFGNNLRFIVSGGAKLPSDVNLFFDQLGINILQGYGLTETCVATNINLLHKNKIGTVGPALDASIEIKVNDDKEVLIKGPNVTQGYWRRLEATESAWDKSGWFHTGDLGSLDSDGYLTITGRKKEIIVSSYGKKVAPLDIEAKLQKSEVIESVLMFGSGKKYCVALIRINEAAAFEDSEVEKLIQSEIDAVNKNLAGYEQIKKFAIIQDPYTIENGLLTPTLKVKRDEVAKRHQQTIDALYID